MKIRINKKGWETYTGNLGPIAFKDGVSVDEVSEMDIARIGASINVVAVDSGKQVGAASTMAEGRFVKAEVKKPLPTKAEVKEEPVKELEYTEEALNKLAEEGGIKAIREVAAKFDVKGVQISDMIAKIMEAQKKAD